MKRLLVVGLGSIGRRHVQLLIGNERITSGEWSVEICDSDSESMETCLRNSTEIVSKKNLKNIPAYSDFSEALRRRQ